MITLRLHLCQRHESELRIKDPQAYGGEYTLEKYCQLCGLPQDPSPPVAVREVFIQRNELWLWQSKPFTEEELEERRSWARKALDRKNEPKHPMQPVIWGVDRVIRFKQNKIVRFLTTGKLNDLALMDFPREDWEQLAQLMGYSVSGACDLEYMSDEVCNTALQISEELSKEIA